MSGCMTSDATRWRRVIRSARFKTSFFFSSRRRNTRCSRDWSSDVCSSDLERLPLPPDLKRKFLLLKLSLPAPPPPDAREAAELTRLTSSMQADYGKGTYCRNPQDCLQITDIERIMASSRDPAELAAAWQGWHRISVGMRDRYARFVTLANAGARGLGFADVGVMGRAGYDMPAA